MKEKYLELKPVAPTRQGWDKVFVKMPGRCVIELHEDHMPEDDLLEERKFKEWQARFIRSPRHSPPA